MLNTNRLLILGDFNIHFCCPSKPTIKEFLQIIDTFNFIQSVFGPCNKVQYKEGKRREPANI